MSGTSWDAVSRSQLWNTKRPVWLQAIIHLVEPHVIPAVVELLDLLDSVRSLRKYTKLKSLKMIIKVLYLCLIAKYIIGTGAYMDTDPCPTSYEGSDDVLS